MFKNLEETSKRLIRVSLAISLIFALLGLLLLSDKAPYAKNYDYQTLVGGRIPLVIGILIGDALNVCKVFLIDRSCKKALEMDMNMGKLYATSQYFTRFLLTGGILVVALLIREISFTGVFLAIISLQFAGYLIPHIYKEKVS